MRELESAALSYASEIDALRKVVQKPVVVNIEHGAHVTLNGQTIGRVHDPERELAKVKAELDSKRRECATEKERAERAESASNARGALLEKIGEALQLNSPVLWDPLPGQVAYVREQQQYEKMRANAAESMFLLEQQKHDDTKKALFAANVFANDHAVMWKRMSASIGMKQTVMMDIVQWIEDTQKKLANAIIPLPKPKKVEPGQKWAKVVSVRDPGAVHGSDAADYVGSDIGILYKNRLLSPLDNWIYLGS